MRPYTFNMIPETWLITGGAGYIGSHVADAFLNQGKNIVIYDSMKNGLESRVNYLRMKHHVQIPLIEGDIRHQQDFTNSLEKYRPYGVIHTAALKSVSESIKNPDVYFEVNDLATSQIIESVESFGINRFIFSSSAAVYGSPNQNSPMKESDNTIPISPYGMSKLNAEKVVNKFLSTPTNYGASLRFFNVVGTSSPQLIDNSTENLVPIALDRIFSGQQPIVFGSDYPTLDGTCVRDYVDVRDIARAHLAVADCRFKLPEALNIGTGLGASVLEVIDLIGNVAGKSDINILKQGRRLGDPAKLLADVKLIKEKLGFSTTYSLEESIKGLISTSLS